MYLLIPLLFVLGVNAEMVLTFKRKFGEVLPVSLLGSALIVTIFGFLGHLKSGAIIVMALGIVAYPVLVALLIVNRKWLKAFAERYFSLGFFAFILVYVFLFVVDYARKIQNWDEIVYWGLRVKEMMRIDQLYTSSESLMTFHQDYPPFMACFQYLWCQMSGGFRDGWLYMSMHLMELSMLIPCIEYFGKKKVKDNIVIVFMTFMLIIASGFFVDLENDAMMYKTIYIDAFMAILSAYGFFFVFMVKKIDWFYVVNVCLVASGLLLSKQSGLGFFSIMILIMIANWFMIHWEKCSGNVHEFVAKINIRAVAFVAGIGIVIPYVFYRIWEWYVASLGLSRQFDPESNRSVVKLVKILMGAGEEYQRTTIINYIQALMEESLMKRPINMAYWQLMLVTIVLFEVVAYIVKNDIPKKYIRMLNVIATLGAAIYAGFMMMLYTFSFPESEAVGLASFRRYLNTYWMIIWVFAGLIIIASVARCAKGLKDLKSLWILLAVLWIVVIDPAEVRKLYPTTPSVSTSVLAENVSEGETIYVLDTNVDNDPRYTQCFIRYRLWPVTVDGGSYEDLYDTVTAEELLNTIQGYDYLYVASDNQDFFDKFDLNVEVKGLYRTDTLDLLGIE